MKKIIIMLCFLGVVVPAVSHPFHLRSMARPNHSQAHFIALETFNSYSITNQVAYTSFTGQEANIEYYKSSGYINKKHFPHERISSFNLRDEGAGRLKITYKDNLTGKSYSSQIKLTNDKKISYWFPDGHLDIKETF